MCLQLRNVDYCAQTFILQDSRCSCANCSIIHGQQRSRMASYDVSKLADYISTLAPSLRAINIITMVITTLALCSHWAMESCEIRSGIFIARVLYRSHDLNLVLKQNWLSNTFDNARVASLIALLLVDHMSNGVNSLISKKDWTGSSNPLFSNPTFWSKIGAILVGPKQWTSANT